MGRAGNIEAHGRTGAGLIAAIWGDWGDQSRAMGHAGEWKLERWMVDLQHGVSEVHNCFMDCLLGNHGAHEFADWVHRLSAWESWCP